MAHQNVRGNATGSHWNFISQVFDHNWYDKEYSLHGAALHGFEHYVTCGVFLGNSPHRNFDEGFYTALYQDVREAIRRGEFCCGFEHYVLFGAEEERLAKHEVGPATETIFPGLAEPVEFDTVNAISWRLRPILAKPAEGPGRIWLLVPLFNPDIFFGGYKAALELVRSFHREGRAVNIVICSHPAEDGVYALWRLKQDVRFRDFANSVVIYNRDQDHGPLEITPDDRIIAYSCWEAFLAHDLAKLTNEHRFILLAQEYEPIFEEHGSSHALIASAYSLPHFPIFNSKALLSYFRTNKIGIFCNLENPISGLDYAVFEHVLSMVEKPSIEEMSSRITNRFGMYARPERHAKRNLFALGIIALRQAIDEGYFRGNWEFFGLGSAFPGSIELGLTSRLQLLPKMSELDYRDFRKSIDVALSLMYSPHPGLVAFELAAAGARVVTNTYENRSDVDLRRISGNIIPCESSIAGIKRGLIEAVSGVSNFTARIAGTHLKRDPSSSAWDDLFCPAFHRDQLGAILNANPFHKLTV